jgi:hypothetical protein
LASKQFDPFVSRRARDIRNGLSEAIIRSLDTNDAEYFRRVGEDLLTSGLASSYHNYVSDRLMRYEQAFSEVQQLDPNGAFTQAIVLWNQGLFFEAHERWETVFHEATGEKRMAIKELIKAFSSYLHSLA